MQRVEAKVVAWRSAFDRLSSAQRRLNAAVERGEPEPIVAGLRREAQALHRESEEALRSFQGHLARIKAERSTSCVTHSL